MVIVLAPNTYRHEWFAVDFRPRYWVGFLVKGFTENKIVIKLVNGYIFWSMI